MVTISTPQPAQRVSLRELMEGRNASLMVSRDTVAAHLGRAIRIASRGARVTLRALLAFLAVLLTGAVRHGLVLAGLASFVTAASLYSPIAGLVTAGAGAFFLEARRK
jgi:hypothetical protein